MSGKSPVSVFILTGEEARQSSRIARLCAECFGDFSSSYIERRVPHVVDPAIVVAVGGNGEWKGFKFGYRRGDRCFYSWIGGVHPDARHQGLAGQLTKAQHSWARAQGFETIVTRTRASNNLMIMVNLKNGFSVTGYEMNEDGIPVVTLRKNLAEFAGINRPG
jgi:GNAT superfamily N-acetyltransferase